MNFNFQGVIIHIMFDVLSSKTCDKAMADNPNLLSSLITWSSTTLFDGEIIKTHGTASSIFNFSSQNIQLKNQAFPETCRQNTDDVFSLQ